MKKILFYIILVLIPLPACDKESFSPVPYRPVNLTLDLDFRDNDLVPMLATKSFTQKRDEVDKLGYGGVLVINGISSTGQINLYAYDLTCPVEIDAEIKVVPNNSGYAICPECGEEYYIASGTGIPTTGISKHSLRYFSVRNTNGNRFLVSN